MVVSPAAVLRLTVSRARHLLSEGLIRAEELALFCRTLAVAGEEIWQLQAFAQIVSSSELAAQTEASEERRRRGGCRSPLEGIPFTIKANLAIDNYPLTAASRILGEAYPHGPGDSSSSSPDDTTPATPPPIGYNADVVRALKEAGAIFVGVTTMDEFGMGSLGIHHAGRDPTKNVVPFLHALQHQPHSNDDDNNILSDQHLVQSIQSSPDQIRQLHQDCLMALALADPDESSSSFYAYSAGGSSCGSAVSVAHGSSLISLGSDTGGSVRLPAAFGHVVGLKPTYGSLSRHGLVSYASSLDTIGVLGRTSHCVALVFDQLQQHSSQNQHPQEVLEQEQHDGPELRDSNHSVVLPTSRRDDRLIQTSTQEGKNKTTSSSSQASSLVQEPRPDLSSLRIGIPHAWSVEECPFEIRQAWHQAAERLELQGATISEISSPQLSPLLLQHSLAAYYILITAEASSNLARYDGFRYGVAYHDMDHPNRDVLLEESDWTLLEQQFAKTRSHGFGTEVIRRILCGTAVLSSDRFHAYYEAAAKLRALLTRQLHSCLGPPKGSTGGCDMLLVPTSLLCQPPKLYKEQDGGDNENWSKLSPVETYANDVMTVPVSLAGLPAVSVPMPRMDETQVQALDGMFRPAMQLIGCRRSELLLLQVASVLEDSGTM